MFLLPDLITAVATQMVVDPKEALEKVVQFVLEDFRRWLPTHAMEVTQHKVTLMLGRFGSGGVGIVQYAKAFADFQSAIDPTAVHSAALAEANAALAASDYKLVLRMFNKKELSKDLGRFFGITKGSYVDKVREMAKRDLGDVPRHIKTFLPDIESHL